MYKCEIRKIYDTNVDTYYICSVWRTNQQKKTHSQKNAKSSSMYEYMYFSHSWRQNILNDDNQVNKTSIHFVVCMLVFTTDADIIQYAYCLHIPWEKVSSQGSQLCGKMLLKYMLLLLFNTGKKPEFCYRWRMQLFSEHMKRFAWGYKIFPCFRERDLLHLWTSKCLESFVTQQYTQYIHRIYLWCPKFNHPLSEYIRLLLALRRSTASTIRSKAVPAVWKLEWDPAAVECRYSGIPW